MTSDRATRVPFFPTTVFTSLEQGRNQTKGMEPWWRSSLACATTEGDAVIYPDYAAPGDIRNALTVLGNVGTSGDLPAAEILLGSPDPMVAEHAAWAVGRLRAR